MDNFTKTGLGLAVGLGSLALVGQSLRMIPKEMRTAPRVKPIRMQMRPTTMPRRVPIGLYKPIRPVPMRIQARQRIQNRIQTRNMVRGATGLMIGIPMISAAASMIK